MKYSEYFEIDKNYYPEINPDSVKNPGNEWQYTYPHETFVELLSSVELMLSRENTELRKGIWIDIIMQILIQSRGKIKKCAFAV